MCTFLVLVLMAVALFTRNISGLQRLASSSARLSLSPLTFQKSSSPYAILVASSLPIDPMVVDDTSQLNKRQGFHSNAVLFAKSKSKDFGNANPNNKNNKDDLDAALRRSKYPTPNEITIPQDKVSFAFARSSGPGGQNVNKLNTKAEVRFNVDDANWLPKDVRGRLKELNPNRINKEGDLIMTSQEYRTQSRNKEDCLYKVKVMIAQAYVEPKDRTMWTGISEKTKERRKDDKRHRAGIKSARRVSKDDW